MTTKKGPWYVSLGAFLWATDALFRSRLVQSFPVTFIVLFDHLLSLPVSIPLFFRERKRILTFVWQDWLSLVFVSLFGSVLGLIFFTQSFATTSNYTVPILIQQLQPLIAILLAVVILKETLTPRFWTWAVLALVGAYLVSFSFTFAPKALLGAETLPIVFALLAAVCWGGSTVAGRVLLQRHPYMFITAARYLMATFWLLLIVLWQGSFTQFTNVDVPSLIIFLLLAYIPGFIALFIYYYGLKTTRASIATICELAYPVSAVAINWIFLGSTLAVGQVIGAVALVGSIFMLSRESRT